MDFISGFSGSTLTKDGYLKPVLSWAIADRNDDKNDKNKKRSPFDYF